MGCELCRGATAGDCSFGSQYLVFRRIEGSPPLQEAEYLLSSFQMPVPLDGQRSLPVQLPVSLRHLKQVILQVSVELVGGELLLNFGNGDQAQIVGNTVSSEQRLVERQCQSRIPLARWLEKP